MNLFRFFLGLVMLIVVHIAFAQEIPLKREMRGVWIATVKNIDWPSKDTLSVDQQQNELLDLIETHHSQGINAIFFQVRPATDAFYKSDLEPWSEWLCGIQGTCPNPTYDPLETMLQLCHSKGIEFHAWFNPYRALFENKNTKATPLHITRLKPEWFINYAGKKLFNPGIPEVREYIVKVILDVVKRYDIDGVHLDDYFYPYPVKGIKLDDEDEFVNYASLGSNKEDWRRDNINRLIKMLNDSIHYYKPNVKFGVSPFGIWKNKKDDVDGSETNGLSTFSAQFADSRKWIKEGWVDYLSPQIYFPFNHKLAPYEEVVKWWGKNTFDRHIYVGHGVYRIVEKNDGWSGDTQMSDQIRFGRTTAGIKGSVFYSSNWLLRNVKGIGDSLRAVFYPYRALPPSMPWLKKDHIPAPKNLKIKRIHNSEDVLLTWEDGGRIIDKSSVAGYVVYRFDSEEIIGLNNPKKIIHLTYNSNQRFFKDKVAKGYSYLYVVTALDKAKNESSSSEKAILK